jgi:hypothetical protein
MVAAEIQRREDLNESAAATAAERNQAAEMYAQFMDLLGVRDKPWALWVAFALVVIGAMLGAGGNLTSSGGVDRPTSTCSATLTRITPGEKFTVRCK